MTPGFWCSSLNHPMENHWLLHISVLKLTRFTILSNPNTVSKLSNVYTFEHPLHFQWLLSWDLFYLTSRKQYLPDAISIPLTLKFSIDSPSFTPFWPHDLMPSPTVFSSLFIFQHIIHQNGTMKNQDFLPTDKLILSRKCTLKPQAALQKMIALVKPWGDWTLAVIC